MLNEDLIAHFWSIDQETLFKRTGSGLPGLSENEANARLSRQRKANKTVQPWRRDAKLLLAQYKNPLVLLLIFAVFLSLILKEYSDGIIVLIVLLSTGIFGFFQERNAGRAVEKLRALVHSKVRVRRDGKEEDIPADEVVTGDIVLLSAGCMIPSDALILESNNLHVNESILTGEAFPVEKNSGTCKPDAALSAVSNSVFKGSSVVSGSAVVLTANAGKYTELGKIASSLESEMSVNAFEIGIMKFGYLLMRLTIIATGAILIFNIILHKPFIDSILFALALAIGLTPELLPVITTITLSAGAKRMAAKKVIVKKLSAIQNLGEIDILCSDKTGTITEGAVQIESVTDLNGNRSDKAWLYAYLNAYFETGFSNPMDDAIRQVKAVDITGYSKCDELPYDFIRKRLSIAVSFGDQQLLITKGAVDNILQVCSFCERAGASQCTIEEVKDELKQRFAALSGNGFRVIGVCYKNITGTTRIGKDDEKDMVFLGFIVLYDPPKKGIVESITALRNTGIALKVIKCNFGGVKTTTKLNGFLVSDISF